MEGVNTNAGETDSEKSTHSQSSSEILEIINEITNENNEIHSHFTEINKDIIYSKRNDKMKMNINYERDSRIYTFRLFT